MSGEQRSGPETVMDEWEEHYQRGYTDGVKAARQLDPDRPMPPCSRCFKADRMTPAGTYALDWGGKVGVVVCLRCGVVGLLLEGERPPTRTDAYTAGNLPPKGQAILPGMPRRMDGH